MIIQQTVSEVIIIRSWFRFMSDDLTLKLKPQRTRGMGDKYFLGGIKELIFWIILLIIRANSCNRFKWEIPQNHKFL